MSKDIYGPNEKLMWPDVFMTYGSSTMLIKSGREQAFTVYSVYSVNKSYFSEQ